MWQVDPSAGKNQQINKKIDCIGLIEIIILGLRL